MQAVPQKESREERLFAELEDLCKQFNRIKTDAQKLLDGLSAAQFNWRPQPGVWSVAECFDHLNISGKLYLPMMDAQISAGRENKRFASEPFHYGWFNNWFVRSLEPPVKTKFKAPKAFIPKSDKAPDATLSEFNEVQDEYLQRLVDANGLDLRRIRIQSPATRLIRLSLGRAFAMVTAHERRHLWQARQVIAHPNFPAE
jgi:hypothetical protein